MQHLKLVYDFADRSLKFGVLLFPLIFIGIGLSIFYYNKNIADKNTVNGFGINKRKCGMVTGVIISLFSMLFSGLVIPLNLKEYYRTKHVYDAKEYKTVEGNVRNYHPMPAGGHDSEKFDVSEIDFEFSDFDESDYGYNNAASKGGAIKDSLFVRICYFDNGNRNVILKLLTE